MKERLPGAEHRQCARHIYANFRKRFKAEEFRKLFWYAAASTTVARFDHWMGEIRKLEPLAYDFLKEKERDPTTWCKAFFEIGRSCDAYENGVSESFNSAIEGARKLPLLTMLEEIRIYAMERLHRLKLEGEKWNNLNICPSIRKKLEKLKGRQS